MEPAVLQARQKAYREILQWGLLAIREAARVGKAMLCEIEADHIHNLPSLLNEPNEKRHHCYIVPERKYYLDRLGKHVDAQYLDERLRWFLEPWKVLMELALPEIERANAEMEAELKRRGGSAAGQPNSALDPPRVERLDKMQVGRRGAGRRTSVRQPDLQPMHTPQPNPQSPAERRSAEAELRALITQFAPAHQRLVAATRRSLRKRLPTAHEVVYEYRDNFVISYSPSGQGYEGVLAIRGSADGVRLYLSGKKLPDPEKLLQGSGSQMRWILLEAASTLARPPVARLIDEAIARNRVPFAPTGRRPVVIRATAAKKRKVSTTR